MKVINCQANVIGLDVLQKRFAGKVCFRTDLDRQNIVPFGTPADVRRHVRDVFDHLGTANGGIVACGEVGPEVPLENIRAMYETFATYSVGGPRSVVAASHNGRDGARPSTLERKP